MSYLLMYITKIAVRNLMRKLDRQYCILAVDSSLDYVSRLCNHSVNFVHQEMNYR